MKLGIKNKGRDGKVFQANYRKRNMVDRLFKNYLKEQASKINYP